MRTCFWYHKSAVGHAIGQDVTTDITWHGDRAAHFVANSMSQGAALIEPCGRREDALPGDLSRWPTQSKNLSVLAYANGFTLWHYRTGDLAADVDNAGYFSAASDMLRVGDFIFVNAGLGSAPVHGVVVVVSNNDGSVDVANISAFATVNSD